MNREEVAKALDALGVTVTLADDPVDGSRIEVVHFDDLVRIGAAFDQAHTPTDDERKVRDFYEKHYSDRGWSVEQVDVRVFVPTTRPGNALEIIQQALDSAGLDIRAVPAGFLRTVQGEPTDAQVNIPEHLSKRDELGPAVRKFLVEEARAENDKRRADEARRLRAAAAQEGENRG